MREINFRGKRDYDGKWIHGAYISYSSINEAQSHYIIPKGNRTLFYRVIPETVGQYTGIEDKNGNKIFEGDIVKYSNILFSDKDIIGEIKYRNGSFDFCDGSDDSSVAPLGFVFDDIEIIGNIYDNPELLRGENK